MDEEKSLLEQEIDSCIKYLMSCPDPSSEEYTAAVDNIAKLYKLKIEEDKLIASEEVREKRFIDQLKERSIDIGIEIVSVVLPLIFYGCWMKRGFEFERTGAYTSGTFRNLYNRFRPTMN